MLDVEKVNIYCPICRAKSIKKTMMPLLKVKRDATGTIYPYCRFHRAEVEIDLRDAIERDDKGI